MCGDFFFFKQKTAYEMRISDWSSDVCSSDLGRCGGLVLRAARICKVGRTAQPPIHPDGGNRKTVRGNRRAGNRIIAMTDEPHNAAETEPAGKLPTIVAVHATGPIRTEEQTSALQSLMRISYAVFVLKKKNT